MGQRVAVAFDQPAGNNPSRATVSRDPRLMSPSSEPLESGEVRPDVIGVWHPELGVDSPAALVVFAGPNELAERAVGVAHAGVGAGLLVASLGVDGEGVRGGVVDEGGGVLTRGVGGFAEAVERRHFAVPVADLTAEVDRLPMVLGGLPRTGRARCG